VVDLGFCNFGLPTALPEFFIDGRPADFNAYAVISVGARAPIQTLLRYIQEQDAPH
jgi:hypothetical protein